MELEINDTLQAIKICREDADGKRGIAGVVECPRCKGKLHYTISAVNGHLWGACKTDNCLNWMM